MVEDKNAGAALGADVDDQSTRGANTGKSANATRAERAAAEAKTRRPLDERIKEAAETLKRLQDLKREEDRQAKLRDEKELRELIRSERLDEFPPSVWRSCVAELRTALTKARQSKA